jgi:DNA-directed RNA polymerase specialized sigma24 family protein
VATGPGILIDHLRRTLAPPLAGLPDDALLRRAARGGIEGEAAFGVLLRRHGPLVLRTCRAALGNIHDADDCFQAVFLVLVRRAATLVGHLARA